MLALAVDAPFSVGTAAGFGENGLAGALVNFGVKVAGRAGVAFGVNVFDRTRVAPVSNKLEVDGAFRVKALDGGADGDGEKAGFGGEPGTGNFPNGLILGVSSLDSRPFFLTGLMSLLGLPNLDGEGLSRMFLKRVEVLEPTELPFSLGVLLCLNGLASSVSFVICDSAFLLLFVGDGAARLGDGFPI